VSQIDGIRGDSQSDAGVLNLNLGAREPEPGKEIFYFANAWAGGFTTQNRPGPAYTLPARPGGRHRGRPRRRVPRQRRLPGGRAGLLAQRIGPRLPMSAGPIVAADVTSIPPMRSSAIAFLSEQKHMIQG